MLESILKDKSLNLKSFDCKQNIDGNVQKVTIASSVNKCTISCAFSTLMPSEDDIASFIEAGTSTSIQDRSIVFKVGAETSEDLKKIAKIFNCFYGADLMSQQLHDDVFRKFPIAFGQTINLSDEKEVAKVKGMIKLD